MVGELVPVVNIHHDGSRRVELVRPVMQPFGFGGWPVRLIPDPAPGNTEFLQRVEAEVVHGRRRPAQEVHGAVEGATAPHRQGGAPGTSDRAGGLAQ